MWRRQNEIKIFEIEHDYEIKITKFSDTLTKSLEENLRKKLAPWRSHTDTRLDFVEAELESILGADERVTRPATPKQRESERRAGAAVNQRCCACRKFLKRNESVNHVPDHF